MQSIFEFHLESHPLAPGTINGRFAAVRRHLFGSYAVR